MIWNNEHKIVCLDNIDRYHQKTEHITTWTSACGRLGSGDKSWQISPTLAKENPGNEYWQISLTSAKEILATNLNKSVQHWPEKILAPNLDKSVQHKRKKSWQQILRKSWQLILTNQSTNIRRKQRHFGIYSSFWMIRVLTATNSCAKVWWWHGFWGSPYSLQTGNCSWPFDHLAHQSWVGHQSLQSGHPLRRCSLQSWHALCVSSHPALPHTTPQSSPVSHQIRALLTLKP